MKNSSIAILVNRKIQRLLNQNNKLGTSFSLYSQKNIFTDQVHENTKKHADYHRLHNASSSLYTTREYSKHRNYNDFETGLMLFSRFTTPYLAEEEIAANAHECSALTIFLALSIPNLPIPAQVNRAIVTNSGDNASDILHEFVIIGEVTGNGTCVKIPMDELKLFLRKNLLPQSEMPWGVDAAFNVVCPLKEYIEHLGLAISYATRTGRRALGSPKNSLISAQDISLKALHAMISYGHLLAVEVTQKSKRLNISENEGKLNYSDFL